MLEVANEFFGGNVAVAGLMVGRDVAAAVAGDQQPARKYLIPNSAAPGGRFLDDVDVADIPAPIDMVPPTVAGLLEGAMR